MSAKAKIYNIFEQERRRERCRACAYFNKENIACRLRNGWKLSKGERLEGCYKFKADLWGGIFNA